MLRQPYKILRGQLSRRDGTPENITDDQGKLIRKGTRNSYVHYSARTIANPNARDEVDLTEEEARAFGLSRLSRLARRNQTSARVEVKEPNHGGSEEDELLADLIEQGENLKGTKKFRAWREDVIAADILPKVPREKAEILDALREAAN